MWTVFLLCLAVLPKFSQPSCLESPRRIRLGSDAGVTIGVVLDIHEPGDGITGCGLPRKEGVIAYETLKWTLEMLNSDNEGQSLVPGVKIGLDVVDTCGRPYRSIAVLKEWFPVLDSGTKACGLTNNSVLAILDGSSLWTDLTLANTFRKYNIPVIPIQKDVLMIATKVQALVAMFKELQWKNTAILHGEEEVNVEFAKDLTKESFLSGQCLQAVTRLPAPQRRAEYRGVVEKLLSTTEGQDLVFIVIASGKSVLNLLEVLSEVSAPPSVQWLFSEPLPEYRSLNISGLRSLSHHPLTLPGFEAYWTSLQTKPRSLHTADIWFLEYLAAYQGCTVEGVPSMETGAPKCSTYNLVETRSMKVRRTSDTLSGLHVLSTLGHALRQAWTDKCGREVGMCRALRDMEAAEFLTHFLMPLNFNYTASPSRFPGELAGGKSVDTFPGKLSDAQVLLLDYNYEGKYRPYRLGEIISFSSKTGLQVTEEDHSIPPTSCQGQHCINCLQHREGRPAVKSNDTNTTAEEAEEEQTRFEPTEHLVLKIPGNNIVMAILPFHQSTPDQLECAQMDDPGSLFITEGLLWGYKKFTEQSKNVSVGLEVYDSCNSQVIALKIVSSLLLRSPKRMPRTSPEKVVAMILGGDKVGTVTDLLLSLNITTLTLTEQFGSGLTGPLFHLGTQLQAQLMSLVSSLDVLKWSSVKTVTSRKLRSKTDLDTVISSLLRARGVCVSERLVWDPSEGNEVTNLVGNLTGPDTERPVAALLILDDQEVEAFLFEALAHNPRDVVWFLAASVTSLPLLQSYGDGASGLVVVSPDVPAVPEIADQVLERFAYNKLGNSSIQKSVTDLWKMYLQCLNCSSEETSIEVRESYEYYVDSVSSVIEGLTQIMTSLEAATVNLCAENCEEEGPRIPEDFHKFVESVPLSNGMSFVTFGPTHSIDYDLDLYNMRVNPDGQVYFKQIGRISDELELFGDVLYYDSDTKAETNLFSLSPGCSGSLCSECRKNSDSSFKITSKDGIYVLGVFPAHSADSKLDCGKNSRRGIEEMAALHLAIEKLNSRIASDNSLIEVGLILVDTCSQYKQMVKEIDRVLTSLEDGTIVAVVTGTQSEETKLLLDLMKPLNSTILSTDMVTSGVDSDRHLLQMHLPPQHLTKAMIALMKYYSWDYVTVVHFEQPSELSDVYRYLMKNFHSHNMAVAADLAVDKDSLRRSRFLSDLVQKVIAKSKLGARVVILLLPRDVLDQFFEAASHFSEDLGENYVLWMTVGNLDVLQKYSSITQGCITIQSAKPDYPDIHEILSPEFFQGNPWLSDLMADIYDCRGWGCHTLAEIIARSYKLTRQSNVATIVDAATAVWNGIQETINRACPDPHCTKLLAPGDLFNVIVSSDVVSLRGNRVWFNHNHIYGNAALEILNLRRVDSQTLDFSVIGNYSGGDWLHIENRGGRSYLKDNMEMGLNNIRSTCIDCKHGSSHQTLNYLPGSNYAILGVMSIHDKGPNMFTCGQLLDPEEFLSIMAFTFALDSINKNSSLLPNLKLGGVLLDTCSTTERGLNQVFSFFSRDPRTTSTAPDPLTTFAAITFDDRMTDVIDGIFLEQKILQFLPRGPGPGQLPESVVVSSDEEVGLMRAVTSLLNEVGWRLVKVLYSEGTTMRSALQDQLNIAGICVEDTRSLPRESDSDGLEAVFSALLGSAEEVQVVVLLVTDDSDLSRLLEVSLKLYLAGRHHRLVIPGMFSGLDVLLSHRPLPHVVGLSFQPFPSPEFTDYIEDMTLYKHDPIPDLWFELFWQRLFNCRLLVSSNPLWQYREDCTGTESLKALGLRSGRSIQRTIATVIRVAEGLHTFLDKHCPLRFSAAGLENCGMGAQELLNTELRNLFNSKTGTEGVEVRLWAGHQGNNDVIQFGTYRGDDLEVIDTRLFDSLRDAGVNGCENESCHGRCGEQHHSYRSLATPLIPSLDENFHTPWGPPLSAVSALGVVLSVFFILYFLLMFPRASGTTLLGYMILGGLLMLFSVNFTFLLPASVEICTFRSFFLGTSLATIFSPVLVKSIVTWNSMKLARMKSHRGCGLVLISMGLIAIQCLFAAGWLVLQPPGTSVYQNSWRCAPGGTYEFYLGSSLGFVASLMAISIVFSLLSWKHQGNDHEQRWLFLVTLVSLLVILATYITLYFLDLRWRELLIMCCNLVTGYCFLFCLYGRKAYWYHKLKSSAGMTAQCRRQSLRPYMYGQSSLSSLPFEQEYLKKAGSLSNIFIPPSNTRLYGISQSTPDMNNSRSEGDSDGDEGIQCSLDAYMKRKTHNKDGSTGSSQITGSDLYPLRVPDGMQVMNLPSNLHTEPGTNEFQVPTPPPSPPDVKRSPLVLEIANI